MKPTLSLSKRVTNAIASAFAGVKLGAGVSIRQTVVMDRYGEGCTEEVFLALPRGEVTSDWSAIPSEELDQVLVAHLDAEGYRYYIPALALSVLQSYDPGSMRVIGTMSSLYPKENRWAYSMQQYSLLSLEQKSALAEFVVSLPQLVALEGEDSKCVPRALRNYWAQFVRNDA